MLLQLKQDELDFIDKLAKTLERIQEELGERTSDKKSLTSLQVLFCLKAILKNSPTMNELVDDLDISTSTLYRTIEKLEDIGFCKKIEDPEDARIRRLIVTDKFEKVIKDVLK